MQRIDVDDRHIITISDALSDQSKAIEGITDRLSDTRRKAFDSLNAALSRKGGGTIPPDALPGFFWNLGNTQVALGIVNEQLASGISLSSQVVEKVIKGSCELVKEYSGDLSRPDSGNEALISKQKEVIQRLVKSIVEGLKGTKEYPSLSSMVAQNIEGDTNKAKQLLEEAIDSDPIRVENYLRLSAIYESENLIAEAIQSLTQGFARTKNTKIFEKMIEVSARYFRDHMVRRLFHAYCPEDYEYPYSYARGVFQHGDNEEELRVAIMRALQEKKLDPVFTSYTKSAQKVLEGNIDRCLANLKYRTKDFDPLGDEVNEKVLRELLGHLETSVFYLFDFRFLTVYLDILKKVLSQKYGKMWLGEFFSNNTLVGIMLIPEDTGEPKTTVSEETIPIVAFDISTGETLTQNLAGRLTFLMIHTSTHSDFEGKVYESTSQSHIGFSHETETICTMAYEILGPPVLEGLSSFKLKLINEEYALQHLGKRTREIYYGIIHGIDEEFGLRLRYHIAFEARHDNYTSTELPPPCEEYPAIAYFFIAERILSGNIDFFQDQLRSLLSKLDKGDAGLVITLAEILFNHSYHKEAIEIIVNCEDAYTDTDGLLIVTNSLHVFTGNEAETEELNRYVDECYARYQGVADFYEYLFLSYQGEYENFCLLIEQRRKESPEGQLVYDDELIEAVEILGVHEYMYGSFSDTNDPGRVKFLNDAIQHNSHDAHLVVLLDRWRNGEDKHEILKEFISHFPYVDNPIRKSFLYWIIQLSLEIHDIETTFRYVHIASCEGLDFFPKIAQYFFSSKEKRSFFYTLYIRQGFSINVGDPGKCMLLEKIEEDTEDESLPFSTRLRAAFSGTQLKLNPDSTYIHGYSKYWDFVTRSFLEGTQGGVKFDEMVTLTEELHSEFDPQDVPSDVTGIFALHFQAIRIYTFFLSEIRNQVAKHVSEEGLKETLFSTQQFLENMTSLVSRFPEFQKIPVVEMEGEKAVTCFAHEYWNAKLEVVSKGIGNGSQKILTPIEFPDSDNNGAPINTTLH